MKALRNVLILVVTAWPLAVGGLAAQGVTTAALFGTVTGSDSTRLEDAVVTVTNTATGERWQTATRAGGRYVFEYLSVGGPYLLEVRAIGFAPGKGPALLLSLGERRQADLSLTARSSSSRRSRSGRDRPAGEPWAHRTRADHR